jgi:cell division septum initiation protein DivIVA
VGGLRDRADSAMQGAKHGAQSAMASVGESIDSTSGMVKEKAQSAMAGLNSTASGIGESISDAYGSVSDTVSWTANSVAQAAASITPSQDELMQAGQRIWDFCKDEPLVVAGLGIAIGAAIGSAIPQTEAENRLMGEAADDLKEKAHDLAADPINTANRLAKSVGGHVLDEATKFVKQEVSNVVSGWGSSDSGGAVQSDREIGTEPAQTGSQSGSQQQRPPYH